MYTLFRHLEQDLTLDWYFRVGGCVAKNFNDSLESKNELSLFGLLGI